MVGRTGDLYGTVAFELVGTTYKPIRLPGSCTYKQATGINNLSEIVGFTTCGIYQYGYAVKNGRLQSVDYPGAQQTTVFGVNDLGAIVGWYNAVSSDSYAYVAMNGKYISFGYPGAKFTAAGGINKAGQIVGVYTLDEVTFHGFVSSPVTAGDFNFPGTYKEALVEGR